MLLKNTNIFSDANILHLYCHFLNPGSVSVGGSYDSAVNCLQTLTAVLKEIIVNVVMQPRRIFSFMQLDIKLGKGICHP